MKSCQAATMACVLGCWWFAGGPHRQSLCAQCQPSQATTMVDAKCAPSAHRHGDTGRAHSHGLRALSGKDVLGSRHTPHRLCALGQGTTRCVAPDASISTLPGPLQLHRCSGEGALGLSLSHCIAPASCTMQLTGTMMLSTRHHTFLQAGTAMTDAREATMPHAQQASRE